MFLTECFSLPKVFLAGTASLGGDRRFVVAFCETRKKSQKISIKKQGVDVFSHPGITLWCWDLKQGSRGFSVWWKLSSKAQQDLRSPCWGHHVSQCHSHTNTLLLLGWLHLILGFHVSAAPRLSCHNCPRGMQSPKLQTLQLIQSTISYLLSNTRFHEHLTP